MHRPRSDHGLQVMYINGNICPIAITCTDMHACKPLFTDSDRCIWLQMAQPSCGAPHRRRLAASMQLMASVNRSGLICVSSKCRSRLLAGRRRSSANLSRPQLPPAGQSRYLTAALKSECSACCHAHYKSAFLRTWKQKRTAFCELICMHAAQHEMGNRV